MTEFDSPLLITLGFDRATFDHLDRLRRRHFPADRNVVPAHLCLFHQLPGDEGEAIDRALLEVSRSHPSIPLHFPGVKRMGRGLMLPVEAPGLSVIRASLARSFDRWLTPQDRQPFRPHVTIMNKADRDEVDASLAEVQAAWTPRTGLGDRLILWRYLGGPWEEVESYTLTGEVVGSVPGTSGRGLEG